MPSIITTDIIRHDQKGSRDITRSHILHPRSDITIMIILEAQKENVMSVLEDHLLETISSTEWRNGEEDADFSYVTEKCNHFLSSLAHIDAESVEIIFSIERGGHLMVSSIGDSEILLEEAGAVPVSIHEDTRGHHHFELISSGDIPVGSTIFIVSRSLERIVGDSFYSDCAHIESASLATMVDEVVGRDVRENVHLIRIQRIGKESERSSHMSRKYPNLYQFSNTLGKIPGKWSQNPKIKDFKESISGFLDEKQSYLLSFFLISGIVLFFVLVSYLVSALFGSGQVGTLDAKNKIIEAKTLVDSSQKLTGNPTAFDVTIKQAESLLSGLEEKNLFPKDTIEQRSRIEALKKELYDIQTIDLSGRQSIVPFSPETFSPVGIYEKDKKIHLIGKKGIIDGYAVGDTGLQITQYPTGEQAKDYAELEDGNFYILTESDKILASRRNSPPTYANIVGQEGWEKSDGIATFNGNIYLWNKGEGQIYKHRPSINGFGQKSAVISAPSGSILDIGIDGGFYIIKENGKIDRIVGTLASTGIVLNGIPGDYTIGKNTPTHIKVGGSLNYVYILDGNRVWIFAPDSKKFQDVKSWTYIAQMEIGTTEKIIDISVPRDGLIYVLTEKGVYEVSFEFIENNVILR